MSLGKLGCCLGAKISAQMFVFKQQNSAADLSMLVLESLEKSEDKVDDDTLGEFYCVC